MKKYITISMILFSISIHGIAQPAHSGYKIAHQFKVEGDGGWDLLTVDEQAGRVFLSHSTVVQCVDERTGALLGSIPANGVHGIALATDLNKGFISNGRDSSVTIFDLRNLSVITKLNVTGHNPDVIIYDPYTHRVFVFNGRSNNATVIDAKRNTVIGTITLDGKPEMAVTDMKGQIYVNIEDKNKVSVLNATTLKVEGSRPIAPGEEASGLALDDENHYLFMVCENNMMVVMNAVSGKVLTTLPIGKGPDGAAFDPGKKRAYSSNGDGTMTVVQEVGKGRFRVLENVKTQKGARTIAIDSKTHHLFLPTAEFGVAPAATTENPRPRPSIIPGSFVLLDVAPLN